ncbi:MBL fold metallo-hydrolase [Chamaesiphon sp. GL140_3_metabinner_50]|uniref:MBL fold metallo-hydrolase n=1 Tax=Chamaesiphon sp. GL140_3_metabinner_50 TaxID=2970812 RepID=UPI0025EC3DA3|nr:MBL fold metallo-hydrolase [Chamaesiphon sp. GL140_3_metabinner_50]
MSTEEEQFKIHFWGVRGSIACPGTATVRYGGNTPCVEMLVGGHRLIFDAGTGIHVLGQSLLGNLPVSGHLFFSHSHWDHIQGFPFFSPAFMEGNEFDIYGGVIPHGVTIEHRLHDQMNQPNFPVPLQVMGANLRFHNIDYGDKIQIGDVTVATGELNHPGGAMGYRVSWQDYTAAYITDTEHFSTGLDRHILALADRADVLIYDCTYTDEEYYHPRTSKIGWGHSTWQEGVKIAAAANVKKLVIFHHDPIHDDKFMDAIELQSIQAFPGSIVAREGMKIMVDETISIAY